MRNLLLFFTALLLVSCTRLGGLGGHRHRFGDLPTKIIWIQVAGLSEEHFAMLHFALPTTYEATSFSKSRCLGKIWTYNLFKLRPSANQSFMSQISGRKNLTGGCEDFQQPPVWNYYRDQRVVKGILEHTSDEENSLLKLENCKSHKNEKYLKDVVFWKMGKAPKDYKLFFHHMEKNSFRSNLVYYDKSCQKEECSQSLHNNVEQLYLNFLRGQRDYFFLIRELEYEKKIKNRDIKSARKILIEIEKIYSFFAKIAEEEKQTLLLLTSAKPLPFEFPAYGPSWKSFENRGTPVIYRSSSLMGVALAIGSRAENFCGIYEESEILQRIIHSYNSFEFDYL